ncbi:glutathione-dependent formaldehyde-activating enzyme [Astrocystis sublimbata]|nr:glutathione-dependent formaldehyde-activating enzyme [Astrocystis sublimbata]
MAEQQEAPVKTYRGNCHCAAFVYEITLPEIQKPMECNCSICYKKGALWAFPKPTDVKWVKGDKSGLKNYNFNDGKFTHAFCPTCGVSPMVYGYLRPKASEDQLPDNGFNVRTLQHGQVDVWNLENQTYDGKALPPVYEAPKFKGPEPEAEVEGGQLHTGSCHCGAVTLALKAPAITKTTQGFLECNCSICQRYGGVWGYFPHGQYSFQGLENCTQYFFNKKIAVKSFCKTCGVVIYSRAIPLTDEELATHDEATRGYYQTAKLVTALNLRVIDGLDVKELSTNQFDGYNAVKPGYVEP